MFKKLNDNYINVNQIIKIESIGIDEKDGKHYCRLFLNDGDLSGMAIEGEIQAIIDYLMS